MYYTFHLHYSHHPHTHAHTHSPIGGGIQGDVGHCDWSILCSTPADGEAITVVLIILPRKINGGRLLNSVIIIGWT